MNVKTKLSDCLRPLMLGALFLGTAANAAVQSIDKVVAMKSSKPLPSVAVACHHRACWTSRCLSA